MNLLDCSSEMPVGEHMGSYLVFSGLERILDRTDASEGLGLRRTIGWVGE